MSSATHDSNTSESNGEVRPGSRKIEQRAARPARSRREGQPPPRRGRNVRPLPVTPPPRVAGDEEQVLSPTSGFASPPAPRKKTDGTKAEINIQARRPVTALRRSSRARGVGTITTLIMGMILLIILAVALVMALNNDDPPAEQTENAAPENNGLVSDGQSSPNADALQSQSPADIQRPNEETQSTSSTAEQPGDDSADPTDKLPANRGAGNPALTDSRPGRQTNNVDVNPPRLDAATLAGLPTIHIMDDGDAKLTGDWNVADRNRQEHAGARYHGEGFRIDNGTFGEHATAQYIFPAMRPGKYLVSISYPEGPNRASNVKVVVLDANGKHELEVDQTEPPERGKFLELGEFTIDQWKPLVVRFSNEGVFGYLAIDAVKAENLDVPDGDGNSDDGGDQD